MENSSGGAAKQLNTAEGTSASQEGCIGLPASQNTKPRERKPHKKQDSARGSKNHTLVTKPKHHNTRIDEKRSQAVVDNRIKETVHECYRAEDCVQQIDEQNTYVEPNIANGSHGHQIIEQKASNQCLTGQEVSPGRNNHPYHQHNGKRSYHTNTRRGGVSQRTARPDLSMQLKEETSVSVDADQRSPTVKSQVYSPSSQLRSGEELSDYRNRGEKSRQQQPRLDSAIQTPSGAYSTQGEERSHSSRQPRFQHGRGSYFRHERTPANVHMNEATESYHQEKISSNSEQQSYRKASSRQNPRWKQPDQQFDGRIEMSKQSEKTSGDPQDNWRKGQSLQDSEEKDLNQQTESRTQSFFQDERGPDVQCSKRKGQFDRFADSMRLEKESERSALSSFTPKQSSFSSEPHCVGQSRYPTAEGQGPRQRSNWQSTRRQHFNCKIPGDFTQDQRMKSFNVNRRQQLYIQHEDCARSSFQPADSIHHHHMANRDDKSTEDAPGIEQQEGNHAFQPPTLNANAKPFKPRNINQRSRSANVSKMTSLGNITKAEKGHMATAKSTNRNYAERYAEAKTVSAVQSFPSSAGKGTCGVQGNAALASTSMIGKEVLCASSDGLSSTITDGEKGVTGRPSSAVAEHSKDDIKNLLSDVGRDGAGADITKQMRQACSTVSKNNIPLASSDSFGDSTYCNTIVYNSQYKPKQQTTAATKAVRDKGQMVLDVESSVAHTSDGARKPGVEQGLSHALYTSTPVALYSSTPVALSVESHRAALIEHLRNASYECMICFGSIRQDIATWSCGKCYHVFHLYCAKKWAQTLLSQTSDCKVWRCPACQEEYDQVPNRYMCFCGKTKEPMWNRHDTPHSCGEVCGKQREENCVHPCNELCHPGPCPPCHATISSFCNCRRSYQTVLCCKQNAVQCSLVCAKLRNCGQHKCDVVCHKGACESCAETLQQQCFCGAENRTVTCGSSEQMMSFSCNHPCAKPLSCGNHICTRLCHSGPCQPCLLTPEMVTSCPCGKHTLAELSVPPRSSCLDTVPSCNTVCGKQLNCGPSAELHTCKRICHIGACGPCAGNTQVKCRCGSSEVTLTCLDAEQYKQVPYLCSRRCKKKRLCGKHKCGLLCCVEQQHICTQICDRKLTCGLHKCEEVCHKNNCPPCYHVSFDELRCRCGKNVLYPPIACGTVPPVCDQPCDRLHACDHEVSHHCHSEASCPLCVVLTTKSCIGGHEMRSNIPCHLKEISCGKPCNCLLICGEHKCAKICHKDVCQAEGEMCEQLCRKKRDCGHPCGAKCHIGSDCPTTPCHAKVSLKCACGNLQEQVICFMSGLADSSRVFPASVMQTLKQWNNGASIDVSDMLKNAKKNQLECNDLCAQAERNARLANALDIVDPEIFASLAAGPIYCDTLKTIARKYPCLVAKVEKAICELVKSLLQSKHQQRSHSFPNMNREQRQLVHELATVYGCTSESYDEEPNRNVVVIANRSKSSLPRQTLTSVVQNELHPKAPLPIPPTATDDELRARSLELKLSTTVQSEDNKIDYFEVID